MASVFERIAAWFGRDRVEEAELAAEVEDDVERERIEQDFHAGKDDVGAAEGTVPGVPTLGQGTPDELYDEFQGDQEAPRDPSP
jgi:hypothetical protein